jgi:mono/diheme cytochrome c family protein
MNSLFRATFSILLLFSIAACGKDEKLNNDENKPATPGVETPFDVAMTPDNIVKGDSLYQHTCAPCHGPRGKGDGPASVALNPKPRDHSNGAYMDKLTNRHIHDVIKMGGAAFGYPTMPGQPQLTDEQVAQAIAFVRTLSPTYKP